MIEDLTDAENRAMELTVQLVNVMAQEIIGDGPTRDADLCEFVAHIHPIQHAIMAQALARRYPTEFRALGEVVSDG